ncbi:ArdC-like ssDNA-binding domain-containing protein [Candidatus Poribacteria bacterium]
MKKTSKFVDKVTNYLKELAYETDTVKKSEFFRRYLEIMSKFWRYSYRNQLLIMSQMPQATKVASFRKWREMKRYVKKGSKAIKITAPRISMEKHIDPDTGKVTEQEEIRGFGQANVFDISQTSGEPLADIDITVDGDNNAGFLQRLLEFCSARNIKVDFKNLGINGLYGYSKGGQISVSDTESINTQTNTLIHEIAHEIMAHKGQKLSRQQREIQAEGVAHVVTKHFGMENKSFHYLALYDADHKKIMENLKCIAGASREIIGFLEERMTVPSAA